MRSIIADDSTRQQNYLLRILREEGHEVIKTFENGIGLVDAVRELKPDFVTLDIDMKVAPSTTEIARDLVALPDAPLVIIVSGNPQFAPRFKSMGLPFIAKPYGPYFAKRLKEELDGDASRRLRAADRIEAL